MRKYNPGEIAPKSGSYHVVDGEGKILDTVTVVKGNRLPPTQSSEFHYELSE